jgi:hypothetical protein
LGIVALLAITPGFAVRARHPDAGNAILVFAPPDE